MACCSVNGAGDWLSDKRYHVAKAAQMVRIVVVAIRMLVPDALRTALAWVSMVDRCPNSALTGAVLADVAADLNIVGCHSQQGVPQPRQTATTSTTVVVPLVLGIGTEK